METNRPIIAAAKLIAVRRLIFVLHAFRGVFATAGAVTSEQDERLRNRRHLFCSLPTIKFVKAIEKSMKNVIFRLSSSAH